MTYPERIVPTETSPGILALHLKRYEFAGAWCRRADVLDAGCGVGYGAAFLAQYARKVVGVDRSEEAIVLARSRYATANVEFVEADVTNLPFAPDSFDVVCAFETVEHLADPDAFVGEARRVLRPTGALIASTPRVRHTTTAPKNPYHRIEFSQADFEQLLRRAFRDVTLYGQQRLQTRRHRLLQRLDLLGLRRRLPPSRLAGRVLGTPATAHVALDDIVIVKDRLADATELIGVCRGPRP